MKITNEMYLMRGKNNPHQISIEITQDGNGRWSITSAYDLTARKPTKLSYREARRAMEIIQERLEWDGAL